MRVVLVALLWWSLSCPVWAQTSKPSSRPTSMYASTRPTSVPLPKLVVEGRVLGQDGKPMAMAHVRLSQNYALVPAVSVVAGSDGRFSLSYRCRGGVQLLFFGVHHKHLAIPLIVRKDMRIRLRVHLSASHFHRQFAKIRIIGGFNQFRRRGGIPLSQRSDGRWQAVVPWSKPRLEYRLSKSLLWAAGKIRGGSAGTHADGYKISGNWGMYRSWVKTHHGKATILFDPKRLPQTPKPAKVFWQEAPPATQALWAATEEYLRVFRKVQSGFQRLFRHRRALMKKRRPGKPFRMPRLTLAQFGVDLSQIWRRAEAARTRTNFEDAKHVYTFLLVHKQAWQGKRPEKRWRNAFCRGWGPRSELWRMRDFVRMGSTFLMQSTSTRWSCLASIKRYLRDMRDPYARALMLTQVAHRVSWFSRSKRMQRFFSDFPTLVECQQMLQQNYIMLQKQKAKPVLLRYVERHLKQMRRILGSNRRVAVGRPLPRFTVSALPMRPSAVSRPSAASGPVASASSSASRPSAYTEVSVRGHWTLIYFWSLWCGGCIDSMPKLHRVYRRFRPKGLRILSIVLAPEAAPVQRFQRKWRMPWWHGIAYREFDAPIAKAFELTGVPRLLLVDPKGRIVALDQDLQDRRIEQTLSRYLP